MVTEYSLADALTREHHHIDAGIEEFSTGIQQGKPLHILIEPLREAMTALRRHIYIEEEFAFPPIKEGGLTMPIMVMEREHGVLWRQMDALETSLNAFTEAQRETLMGACQNMLEVLESHNSKEEPIIYPHLDTQLTPEQSTQLRVLIESGTTPPGWVCARANEGMET